MYETPGKISGWTFWDWIFFKKNGGSEFFVYLFLGSTKTQIVFLKHNFEKQIVKNKIKGNQPLVNFKFKEKQ